MPVNNIQLPTIGITSSPPPKVTVPEPGRVNIQVTPQARVQAAVIAPPQAPAPAFGLGGSIKNESGTTSLSGGAYKYTGGGGTASMGATLSQQITPNLSMGAYTEKFEGGGRPSVGVSLERQVTPNLSVEARVENRGSGSGKPNYSIQGRYRF